MITKDTVISDVINSYPEAVNILMDMGMHCVGCPAARSETLEQSCEAHEIDLETMLSRLNGLNK